MDLMKNGPLVAITRGSLDELFRQIRSSLTRDSNDVSSDKDDDDIDCRQRSMDMRLVRTRYVHVDREISTTTSVQMCPERPERPIPTQFRSLTSPIRTDSCSSSDFLEWRTSDTKQSGLSHEKLSRTSPHTGIMSAEMHSALSSL